MSENPPTNPGFPLVGIELEGVGSVRSKWNDKSIIEENSFEHEYKKARLVRSNSFTNFDGVNGSRGIGISPEQSSTFGTQSPAELVSQPHRFNVRNLIHLRNSLWKALSTQGVRTGSAQMTVDDTTATHDTRWAMYRPSRVGGSLQTTIGVGVHKLLSNHANRRRACIKMLVGEKKKQARVMAFATSAVALQRAMCADGGPLENVVNLTPAKIQGIRFALFQALVLAGVVDSGMYTDDVWHKNALGANFKGASSWKGCGVSNNPFFLELPARANSWGNNQVVAAIQAVNATGKSTRAITQALTRYGFTTEAGKEGLAISSDCEDAEPINNFIRNGHLYTVVECREKSSPVNIAMAKFLNSNQKVINPNKSSAKQQATTLISTIGPALGNA